MLLVVDGYIGDEVNGRMRECVVDGKESSKAVEGCGLDGVLSSISVSFVCASPRYFVNSVATSGLWRGSEWFLSPPGVFVFK